MKGFSLLEKYCRIEKQYVYAKENCQIKINTDEFKNLDEEMIDVDQDDENEELSNTMTIPGSFQLEFEDNTVIDIYLPFNVNLIISDQLKEKNIITIFYNKDDLIFCAFTKESATDISRIDALYNNSIKYLTGKIDKQLLEIYKQLLSTNNISMHHIELLLSQIYVDKTEEGYKPLRLTGKDYKKEYAVSSKDSAHQLLSDSQAFNYGYVKDMMVNSLVSDGSKVRSDLDDIIIGNFHKEEKINKTTF